MNLYLFKLKYRFYDTFFENLHAPKLYQEDCHRKLNRSGRSINYTEISSRLLAVPVIKQKEINHFLFFLTDRKNSISKLKQYYYFNSLTHCST